MKQPSENQLHPFCVWDEADEEYYSGYIDCDGNVVIPPIYEIAEDFSEGLACVAELGWGKGYKFIDTNGEVIISLKDGIRVCGYFHEGLCVVSVDGKYGFIDRTGAMVIPPEFNWASGFDRGRALVSFGESESGDNSGIIDRTGRFIVPPKYNSFDYYWYTEDGLLRLRDVNVIHYFDRTGKQIWPKEVCKNEN